ncbi:MAG: tripartite tricarboxylate transporter substrate binding protein [Achromobacter sp.]
MNKLGRSRRGLLAGAFALLAPLSIATHAMAAEPLNKFPDKPVILVVPYAAGGGTDIVGRNIAQRLSTLWGQSVVVENRSGANGVIGSSMVSKSPPDGHTLMLVVGSHAINPVLMKSMPYDTNTAFTPITRIADSPMVLVAAAKGPYPTLKDALTAARAQEMPLGFSEGHTRLTGEMIRQAGNLKTLGVPYKGGGPLMIDIMGGHVPMGVTSVLTAMPHVQSGNLRVLGVADDKRSAVFPDAMTFKEAGLGDVKSLSWYGLLGPAGMPDALVARIRDDIKKVTQDPAVIKQMQEQGAEIVVDEPAAFKAFLVDETRKWAAVAERGGIKAE